VAANSATLALVARYADWYNFNSCTVAEYAHKIDVLKHHCERIGRNPSEITLTYLSTISVSDDPQQVKRSPDKHFISGNADEVILELEQFQALGVRHCMLRISNLASLEYFVTYIAPHSPPEQSHSGLVSRHILNSRRVVSNRC